MARGRQVVLLTRRESPKSFLTVLVNTVQIRPSLVAMIFLSMVAWGGGLGRRQLVLLARRKSPKSFLAAFVMVVQTWPLRANTVFVTEAAPAVA
jgi:hypothetical protein